MRTISLDGLTEEELLELNRNVIERIRMIRHLRAQMAMVEFSIGERVCFENQYGHTLQGTVVRWNRKSVSVDTDCGHRWRVGPSLLRRVEARDITPRQQHDQGSLLLDHDPL